MSDTPLGDECEHDWKFVRDWYGDPNVINGTADCSYWECKKCGEMTNERPDGWTEKPEQEYEYEERDP